MKKALMLLAAVVLQTAALVAMIAQRQWIIETGTPVVLEVTPVDPRSLFSGDYVELNFKINELPLALLTDEPSFKNDEFAPPLLIDQPQLQMNDTVYVLLRKGEIYWEPIAVTRTLPEASTGQVLLRGKVSFVVRSSRALRVLYGIESYFVPAGEGRKLDMPGPGDKFAVEAHVSPSGKAVLSAILVNGSPLYSEILF